MSPGRAQSNAILREWCPSITGTVLSIGSSSDQDGGGVTYREYFAHADRYLTSEPTPGQCDLALDVRSMPTVADESCDAVFCSGVLEHVDDCHVAVRECWRVLKAGGTFLVGVPFAQPLHRAPQDFWRFTEYGVRFLLRAFAIDDLRAIGEDPKSPSAYLVRARKVAAC
jgi:SAM-dependent methyltransferase